MVGLTYIIGTVVKREGTGQALVILINLVIGGVGGTAIFIMRMYEDLVNIAKSLANIFRIIPGFCFCYGYNTLLNRYLIFATDLEVGSKGMISFEKAYLIVTKSKLSSHVIKLEYTGSDFIYLAVETFTYILILIIIENSDKIFFKCFTSKIKPKDKYKQIIAENEIDNNIIEQNRDSLSENNQGINNINNTDISILDKVSETYVKNEIKKAKKTKDQDNYSIKIINLIKNYYKGPFGFKIFKCCFGEVKAVRDITLCLNHGECFGFLGVNGAGKTTTFKCLSKEILPTYGKIYIENKEINEDFDKVRSLIGYCPQFDAFFESLTVYENLEFYGIIKGAKKDKISLIINALLQEMSLMPFKDIVSCKLSGGNKRKLSVAIAIICNPPIILLDEPSTGVDPEARRHMWRVIHSISLNRKKSTIIMTTHSMEEAETLCKRIAIMIDGQFQWLATSDEIKLKYGYGYEIKLQINNPNYDDLFNKYNISDKDINALIDLNNLDLYLEKYKLIQFKQELKEGRLGEKIITEIKICGNIYFKRILTWIYYLENALKMIEIILEDFPEIHCSDFGENYFVFKIKRNQNKDEKSIGYLFGIIEENNSKFNIEQFFLQLTSLEQIFHKFARRSEKKENLNIYMNNIDIPIDNELISFLYKST